MNDHRRRRLKQLATGLALVSSSAFAEEAPKPADTVQVNSPNPAYEKPKPPKRVNSPPDVRPEWPAPALDAGVSLGDGAQPPTVNSPPTRAPKPIPTKKSK